jgi:hypothetical protein
MLTAAVTVRRALVPPRHGVTVVLRLSEGAVQAAGTNLTTGEIRAYINDAVFSNANLIDVMRRHPESFRGLDRDPMNELEDFRKGLEVYIAENDYVEERSPNDLPRWVRVEVSYYDISPTLAWTITHELADLLRGSTMEQERAAQARQGAAAAAAIRGVEVDRPGATERLRSAAAQDALARVRSRATDENQALRFEVMDEGRLPTPPTTATRVTSAIIMLILALLGAALLAGAFDPRVLDMDDLIAAGVMPLGHIRSPAGTRPEAGNRSGADPDRPAVAPDRPEL